MIHSLWRKRPGKALGRRGRLANPRVRPRLEVLEGRTLPGILTVLNNTDSGPDSLRDALSRAANGDLITFDPSLAGTTITLTSGELTVAANVVIEGLGADQLTVSGNDASRVFNVAPGEIVSLSGLTIADGKTAATGGGVWNRGRLTLSDCAFQDNAAGSGGALDNSASSGGGTATVLHCTFTGNSAANSLLNADGGAITNEADGALFLSGCTFSGNTADLGGAVATLFQSQLTIADSTFTDNTASARGGAVDVEMAQSLVTVRHSAFTGNATSLAGLGTGGGAIASVGNLDVNDATFTANSASDSGFGGAVRNDGSATVTNSTFANKHAVSGGALENTGALALSGDTFQDNSAASEGGGLYNAQFTARADVHASTFTGNTARTGGAVAAEVLTQVNLDGCMVSANTADFGGGIYNDQATVHVSASTFTGNAAPATGAGGAVAMIFAGTTTVEGSTFTGNSAGGGGAVLNEGTDTSQFLISNSTFSGNTATDGGALFSGLWAGVGNGPFGTVTVRGSTFTGNSAAVGGALFNSVAALTVADSTLDHNQATMQGGGAILNQGVDASHPGMLTVTTSTLFGNSAAADGGAISDLAYGALTVESATIDGNAADTCGGGVFLGPLSAAALIHNTIVAGNQAGASGQDVSGTVGSQGYNLIGTGDGSSGWASTDLLGTDADPIDPRLGPLQDNGGPTQTQALLADSPAIAAGDPALLGTADQRGTLRTGHVDIGAFQAAQAVSLRLVAPAPALAGQAFTLTVVALDAQGNVASTFADTVHFDSSGPDGLLPDDYAFAADDGGRHDFAVTLFAPREPTVTTTDLDNPSLTAEVMVTVCPGGG
jgi:hypothetical protein